jgi:hypothetical protein
MVQLSHSLVGSQHCEQELTSFSLLPSVPAFQHGGLDSQKAWVLLWAVLGRRLTKFVCVLLSFAGHNSQPIASQTTQGKTNL